MPSSITIQVFKPFFIIWKEWRIRNYTIFKQKLICFLSAMLIISSTIFLNRRLPLSIFFYWLTALTAIHFHTQSNSQLIKQIIQSQQSLKYINTHALQHLIPNAINSPLFSFLYHEARDSASMLQTLFSSLNILYKNGKK